MGREGISLAQYIYSIWEQSIEYATHSDSHSRKQATTLRVGPTSCSTAPKCNPVACGQLAKDEAETEPEAGVAVAVAVAV